MGFNKNEYINAWKKEHKKQFKVELNIEEYEKLTKLLNKNNLTKVGFIRKSMKILEKDNTQFLDL